MTVLDGNTLADFIETATEQVNENRELMNVDGVVSMMQRRMCEEIAAKLVKSNSATNCLKKLKKY